METRIRPRYLRVCVLLLQDLLQSCSRGGGRRVEVMCYERRRAEACVDESLYQMYIVEAWRVRGKMRGGENIRLPGGLLKTLR